MEPYNLEILVQRDSESIPGTVSEYLDTTLAGAFHVDSNGLLQRGYLPNIPVNPLKFYVEENLLYLAHMAKVAQTLLQGRTLPSGQFDYRQVRSAAQLCGTDNDSGQVFPVHAHGPDGIYDFYFDSQLNIKVVGPH